jgi:hypothetical protein
MLQVPDLNLQKPSISSESRRERSVVDYDPLNQKQADLAKYLVQRRHAKRFGLERKQVLFDGVVRNLDASGEV